MRRVPLLAAALYLLVVTGATASSKVPLNNECIHWVPAVSGTAPAVGDSELAFAGKACTLCISGSTFSTDGCGQYSDILPCYSNSSGELFGHRDFEVSPSTYSLDYCRVQKDGMAHADTDMWVPVKGPQFDKLEWVRAAEGHAAPANVIQFGKAAMARSRESWYQECVGKGIVGWTEVKSDGKLSGAHCTIGVAAYVSRIFEIAVCNAVPTTEAPATSAAPPTRPPNNKPYIRFGNTVPSAKLLQAVLSQPGGASYTWTSFGFGNFSGWREEFSVGPGTLTLYEVSAGGVRGQQLLQITTQLTAGPLVVVAKGPWPPSNTQSSWEAIAASYVTKPNLQSGIRLFNLIANRTMNIGAKVSVSGMIANNVPYSLGSPWATVPPLQSQQLTVFEDDAATTVLTSVAIVPPANPFVCTAFVMGVPNGPEPFLPKAVVLTDAPEH